MSKVLRGFVALATLTVSSSAAGAGAQTDALPTRMVPVEGRAMRVWTLGVEQRKPGQPVVILESGTGGGLETWKPVFAEIARLAPVLAYDRRGVGQSEPDSVTPTLHRVAQSLHALLQQMSIPPPYVLVGHSWGGAFVRSFSDVYPAEVAGLVFLDVTDFVSTREEKASRGPAC